MAQLTHEPRASESATAAATAPSSEEDRLVRRAQAGDAQAFDELAGRYSTRLRRVLYRITRDCEAAKDAVQEALLRAWQNIGRFQRRSRFYTWLTSIGIREAYGSARRSSRHETLAAEDSIGDRVPDWGAQPDATFESREFLQAVANALDELPPDYRTAVSLRDVEGLSTSEAAEALGIGERALKSRLHRGRMALRAKLDEYFAEGYV